MPKPVNTTLRIAVPLIASLLGLGVVWSVWKVGQPQPTPSAVPSPAVTPDPAPGVTQALTPAEKQPESIDPTSTTAEPDTKPVVPPPSAASSGPLAGLTARQFSGDPLATFDMPIGGLDPKGPMTAQVQFSPHGAGWSTATFAAFFDTIERRSHLVLQSEHVDAANSVLTPMAALAIEVQQADAPVQVVGLVGSSAAPVWRRIAGRPGAFEAEVVDGSGEPVLRITRVFSLAATSRIVRVEQAVENLSGRPLTVRWFQIASVDPPSDSGTYGGDKRVVRFGYLLSPERDPSRAAVLTGSHDKARGSIIGERVVETAADGTSFTTFRDWKLWPTPEILDNRIELSWIAYTNRYFGIAVHPLFDPAAGGGRSLRWLGNVDRVVLDGGPGSETLGLRLTSVPLVLGASGTPSARADLTHGVYIGPLEKKLIRSESILRALHLDRMVVYNFGGPCGFCTFDWLTGLLLSVLRFLHDSIFRDWALSIIFLVVIVRTCLHPLTRWTQIRMGVFGKQMAGIGPKQKQIQERFKDDPAKMQQETAKLWREEGISPAGFLGCLPAFAQTPVWIALSAILFFAVELRHQPAFYGVFQRIQPQGWPTWWFLGDLAEPDSIIHFGRAIVTLPLLGPITSINLLPLLLGIVFYIQQKYLQPPTATQLTPEQEMQAKMMKWMTVFLFPLMMYNAPAGLALYFTVNSTLAIFESKWIRSHMEKHGMLDLDKIKAAREARKRAKSTETGGFMARLQQIAEQQQEAKKRFGQERKKK
ncbi:MAG: membrane protein insertase YidC [Phycisphaerae bacterium]|nr:membrane protein insertase YidC [Phycisphaerae bacterium]